MISEERIRQIFSEQLCGLKPTLYDWEIKAIQAVAAEAREEGIEEAAKVIECDGPWTLLDAIARVNALKGKP